MRYMRRRDAHKQLARTLFCVSRRQRVMHVGLCGMKRERLALVPDSSQTFDQNGGWFKTLTLQYYCWKILALVLLPAARSSENERARRYAHNRRK